MKLLPFCLLLLCLPQGLQAQSDSSYVTDYMESYLEAADGEAGFDFNTLFEELSYFKNNPLDINRLSGEDLQALGLLSELQVQSFLQYRQYTGNFLAIQEIQAIPHWDMKTVRILLPFLRISQQIGPEAIPLGQRIRSSDHEVYLRWGKNLQLKKGYLPNGEGITPYAGSIDQLYLRYRMRFDRFWSAGFTAEKDPGEAFFKEPNRAGFDYYSFHAFARNLNPWLKAVALGDFSISMGQGLILHSGFGGGKSAFVTQIKKNGLMLRPYTSVSEFNFRRGAAVEIQAAKNWTLMAFGSWMKRDANLSDIDTLLIDEAEVQSFSSLQESGLHRTAGEIADKHAIHQASAGSTLRYRRGGLQLSANVLYDHFDKPLQRDVQPYNQFQFNGKSLAAGSLDYSMGFRNVHFFGETALSQGGQLATLNGAIIALDRKIDLAVLYRYFSMRYQAILSNPFSESGQANNEQGIYTGITVRPSRPWEINVFYDQWRHPWLRYQVDAPSTGREILARVSFSLRRKLSTYLQFRLENKDKNDPYQALPLEVLTQHTRQYIRLQINYILTPGIEFRSRVEHSRYQVGGGPTSQGWLIYQDLVAKPLGQRYSFSTRIALFDTDDYNSRFYTYENDLIYDFSIPALYNRGIRFYLNARYQGIRNLSLEARYAVTRYSNIEEIGSGNETIAGRLRSEVKAQLVYRL